MSFVVKVSLGDEKRKFKLENPSYELLHTTIIELFQLKSDFIVQYIDEDEDLLTISSDLELQCAFECESTKLQIILKVLEEKQENEEDTSKFPNFFESSIIEQLSNFQQKTKPTEKEIAERKMKYKQYAKKTIIKVSFLS
jgi:predicted RNA-binding protein with RPS1 domain